ncbi:hypothetical protein [Paenibacillus pini]|uniref:hypothetical protein n=1 Tax=Paenibacillus pini TaxID=669461 RepID=UPI00056492BB|nr:hypothetical protein [Paenibacillus pini]
MPNDINTVPVWVFILGALLLLGQATWLFWDAGKRGKRKWFWGIWGLTQFPSPLLVYLILNVYLPYRKKNH